jgi:transposase
MKITRVGLDIAKQVLQVHGVDEHGVAKVRKTLTRGKALEFFAQLPPCLIGMEACGVAGISSAPSFERREDSPGSDYQAG